MVPRLSQLAARFISEGDLSKSVELARMTREQCVAPNFPSLIAPWPGFGVLRESNMDAYITERDVKTLLSVIIPPLIP